MKPTPDTLKLPAELVGQLGLSGFGPSKKGSLARRGVPQATRKDRRKAERNERKVQRGAREPPFKRQKIHHVRPQQQPEKTMKRDVSNRNISEKQQDSRDFASALESEENPPLPTKSVKGNSVAPKSILKTIQKQDSEDFSTATRSPSPPVSRRPSRAAQERLAEDDAEIAFLEKKLGIRGKKKVSLSEDGLDELLSGLSGLDNLDNAENEGKKTKREGDDWLAEKRKKALKGHKISSDTPKHNEDEGSYLVENEEPEDDSDTDDDFEQFQDSTHEDEGEDGEVGIEEFSGFESEEDAEPALQRTRVRENPYVAPVKASDDAPAKYIPPSLRMSSASESEALVRLRRQTQGLVNRLTEANLISILTDIEKLYRENPRQHVTSTLVELLLVSICEPTALPDTLIILPAGFITAVYKVIGTDFGAQVIQRVVELFTEHYSYATRDGNKGPQAATTAGSKETSNLITILSELYNFQVVGSNLIFDYIRLFLGDLSELNAELLLKIIRSSGPQLRKDDPSSLKDIVAMLRPAVERVGEANISVRTKFMIETINDLKNNKLKTGAAASAVVSEHTVRMKKILGSLNTRSIKGSEPLRIGLQDIQDSDKKGKWWLVGASWAGYADAPLKDDSISEISSLQPLSTEAIALDTDFVALARAHRMNTDIRRAIFITIMSSTDFTECHLRLLKLRLKRSQELEIPKILIYCAGAEAGYNHYYTLIAKKLSEGDRKLKMAFQFGLWDLFKRMGEINDDNDGDDAGQDPIDLRALVNFAKLFGSLVASRTMSLTVLKKLTWAHLQENTSIFLEVLFITVFLEIGKDEQALHEVFSVLKDAEALGQGVLRFVKKVVKKTEVAGSKKERDIVKAACGKVIEQLRSM